MRETNKTKRVIRIRIKNPLILCRTIVILIILVWGVVSLIKSCGNLTEPQNIYANKLVADEYTIENNIEEVLQLREFVWEELSTDKRLKLLQTVVNIEMQELGVNTQLKITSASLEPNTLGCYRDYDHIIKIDIEHLMNSRSHDVLKTVLHECRHAYQYKTIEMLDEIGDEYKNLYLCRGLQQLKEGFENYEVGSMDWYWHNPVEIDARSYAEKRIKVYYSAFANDKSYH